MHFDDGGPHSHHHPVPSEEEQDAVRQEEERAGDERDCVSCVCTHLVLVLQQRLRELKRTALVEVSGVRPVHSGHGEDINAFRVAVFRDG